VGGCKADGQELEQLAVGVPDEKGGTNVTLLDNLSAVLDRLCRDLPYVLDRNGQVGETGLVHASPRKGSHRARRRVVHQLEDETIQGQIRGGHSERGLEATEFGCWLVGWCDLVPGTEPEHFGIETFRTRQVRDDMPGVVVDAHPSPPISAPGRRTQSTMVMATFGQARAAASTLSRSSSGGSSLST